ncbi:MAG: exodeoxyribonuclease VII small subunit [Candidatus Bruticola sp.]
MKDKDKTLSYEAAYEELEQIVGSLEKGEQSLEETLKMTARAKTLLDYCTGQLKEAQEQLEILQASESQNSEI